MSKQAYDHLFKILLIGDSGVGKTCVMCRYSHNSFSSNYVSTIGNLSIKSLILLAFFLALNLNFFAVWLKQKGVDFIMKTVEINGKKIKLQLW